MPEHPKHKHTRTVSAPTAIGRGAVNHVSSVVVAEDEDVVWAWTCSPDGTQFVSGYRIVPHRAPKRALPPR